MFELPLNGLWKIPSLKQDVHGALVAMDGQWKLAIHDFSIERVNFLEMEWDYIHGVTISGEKIALIDCFIIKGVFEREVNKNRAFDPEIFVNSILYGSHITKTDNRVKQVDVQIDGLNRWLHMSGLSQNFSQSGMQVEHKQGLSFFCYLEKYKIEFLNLCRHDIVTSYCDDFNIKSEIVVRYTLKKMVSVDSVVDLFYPLICMVSLCCHSNVRVISVVIYVKIKKRGKWEFERCILYYLPTLKGEKIKNVHKIFGVKHINDFCCAIKMWHENFDNVKFGLPYYLECLGPQEEFVVNKVVASVKFIESYLRESRKCKYIDDDKYDNVIEKLGEIIDALVEDEGLNNSLKQNILNANSCSLGASIIEFSRCYKEIITKFMKWRQFKKHVSNAIDIRNSVSHATNVHALSGKFYKNMVSYAVCELIVALCFFECLGVVRDGEIYRQHPYFERLRRDIFFGLSKEKELT